jgi:hypothetical protein
LASTPLAASTASNLSEFAPLDEMLDRLCSEFVSPDAPGKPNSKFLKINPTTIQISMVSQNTIVTRGVSQCGLAIFTLKSILRQKKNYGNSSISPCKNIIFKKSCKKKNQNLSRYYNSITNLKFQHKPKYHLSKLLIK